MIVCTRYYVMWLSLSVTCGRSVLFSGYSGFLHQYNRLPRYNWNIVESGVKHHSPSLSYKIVQNLFSICYTDINQLYGFRYFFGPWNLYILTNKIPHYDFFNKCNNKVVYKFFPHKMYIIIVLYRGSIMWILYVRILKSGFFLDKKILINNFASYLPYQMTIHVPCKAP